MTEKGTPWKTIAPRAGWLCAAAVFVGVAVPRSAHAQFGIDLAVILAGLQKISSLLTSSVASPLKQIQSVEQDAQQFQQTVLYPQQAINSAKALSASFTAPMQSMQSLMNLNFSSATMPNPQQLEQQMLSGNPNNIAAFGSSYSQVYGTLPVQTAAPQKVRSTIDMTDAQAQDAMKKAIELDALATRELEVAQSLNQQIQTAAPGTAPILEAEGSAWVLQANAYSQSAMAALLRVRTTELSNMGTDVKNSTAQAQQLNQNLQGIVTPR
jgi:hypothetical protein